MIPRRVVPRLTDLHPEEITDLFLSVQRIGRVVEGAYKAQALSIAVQVKFLSGNKKKKKNGGGRSCGTC